MTFDSRFRIPRLTLRLFLCFARPSGIRQRLTLLRQLVPKLHRCFGQIVNSARFGGFENSDARAKIRSISVEISVTPNLLVCRTISLLQDTNWVMSVFRGYRLSRPQGPLTNLKTSIFLTSWTCLFEIVK